MYFIRFFFISAYFIFLFAGTTAASSFTDIFQTEEDIFEALVESRLTFEHYQELVELLRDKIDVNSKHIHHLTIIPGIDFDHVEELIIYRERNGAYKTLQDIQKVLPLAFDRIKAFIEIRQPTQKIKGKLTIRHGQYLNTEHEYTRQLETDIRYKRTLHVSNKLYQENYDDLIWKRLSFVLRELVPGLDLTFGHFKESFGQKLVVGGDHAISSSHVLKYILLPENTVPEIQSILNGSYFQGIRSHYAHKYFTTALFYSTKDLFTYAPDNVPSTTARDKLYAGNITVNLPHLRVGISGLSSTIMVHQQITRTKAGGMHGAFQLGKGRLFGEFAALQGGAKAMLFGGVWKEPRVKSQIYYRNYDPDFINYYSRGLADSDGDDNDADETGWIVKTYVYPVSTIQLWGTFNFWDTPSRVTSHKKLGTGIRYKPGNTFKAEFSYEQKTTDIVFTPAVNGAYRVRSVYSPWPLLEFSEEVKYKRSLTGTLREYQGGFAWLQIKIAPHHYPTFSVRTLYSKTNFSSNINGYWKLYFTESVNIYNYYSLFAKYTFTEYNDPEKVARHNVRIVMSKYWK